MSREQVSRIGLEDIFWGHPTVAIAGVSSCEQRCKTQAADTFSAPTPRPLLQREGRRAWGECGACGGLGHVLSLLSVSAFPSVPAVSQGLEEGE